MKIKLLLNILFLNFGLVLYAQDSLNSASIRLNKSQIIIGEQFELILDIKISNDFIINNLNIIDSLDNRLELLHEFEFDTIKYDSKNLQLQKHYLLTCFDSAMIQIKPIQIFFHRKNFDSVQVFCFTNQDSLYVNTLTIENNASIKDVKTIEGEPFQWKEIYPYLLGISIALAMAILFFLLYRRWKKNLPVLEIFKPKAKPAHILAFEQLKELDNKKLWHSGQVKEYYTELSDIFRLYLENRFQIPALEQITEEIINSLNLLNLDNELIHGISEMLKLADSVKFAKFNPLPNENTKAIETVFAFVDKTKISTEADNRKEANI